MATAPAIVRLVGGDARFALDTSEAMYEITLGENPTFQLPILDFRGAPTGIDVTRVVSTGTLPQINTGMAGRVPGTGQVGAGLVRPAAAWCAPDSRFTRVARVFRLVPDVHIVTIS
jgi:hypothetical protein